MQYDRSSLPWIPLWAALAALLLLPTGPAWSQDAAGLHKSDLVRLLTAGTHTQDEIAALVRRNCLSFQPTERDLRNLRLLGAGPSVMREIDRCGPSEGGGEAPSPRTPPSRRIAVPETPPAPPPAVDRGAREGAERTPELTLFVSPRRAAVRPGEEVELTAEVTAGAVPVRGVLLQLDEADEDGLSTVLRTDGGGRAVFRVPATATPSVRRFTVSSPSDLEGTGEVVVETLSPEGLAGDGGATAAPEDPEARTGREVSEATPGPGPETTPPGPEAEEAAEGTAEVAGEEETDLPGALVRAESLSLRGSYGEAGSLYERLLERHPESVEVRVDYAYHLVRRGMHARAGTLLEGLGEAPDAPPAVRKARAFLALWAGEPEKAVEAFRALVEGPAAGDVEVWRGLARALMEVGREEEARRALRRARELEG